MISIGCALAWRGGAYSTSDITEVREQFYCLHMRAVIIQNILTSRTALFPGAVGASRTRLSLHSAWKIASLMLPSWLCSSVQE